MTAAFAPLCAQTANDGYVFSLNDYLGTAKTVGMGNAVTALGGDIGAVGINPAASAVAGYSQYTITPGLNISIQSAQGTISPSQDQPFANAFRSASTKFTMPNVGFTINYKTNRYRGLRSFSLGVVMNRTASYMDNIATSGANSETSMMGSLAAGASGLTPSQLSGIYAMAYNSGMISTFANFNDQYIGTSEAYEIGQGGAAEIWQAGLLNQKYSRGISGSKNDFLFNAALNINDELYIGGNFGVSMLSYIYGDCFKEIAADPSDFYLDFGDAGTTCFDNMSYSYDYEAEGVGLYAKLGVIWAPRSSGLRLGAAIQTPTAMMMEERWGSFGETCYTDRNFDSHADGPSGEDYSYMLKNPFRFNVGAAYTFGAHGVASLDYEFCYYSSVRFSTGDLYDRDFFMDLNQDVTNTLGASHNVRAGVEFKPVNSVALRAGFGYLSSGQRILNETGRKVSTKAYRLSPSIGAGYVGKGSFFLDAACRLNLYEKEYIYPYDDYVDGVYSPEILNTKKLLNILLTVGYRF